jgi:hemerythrin superfamily protein
MKRSQGTKSGRAKQDRELSDRAMDRSQNTNYTEQVIEMLTEDHRAAEQLFRQGEKFADDPNQLQPIAQRACAALTQHAEIEEEFFYPALREKDDDHLIAEAQVEHNSAKQLIADLESMDPDDERYHATFKVLGEYVKHHIKEEEDEIFPLARKSKADFEPLFEALSAKAGEMEGTGEIEQTADDVEQAPKRRTPGTRSDSRTTSRSGR